MKICRAGSHLVLILDNPFCRPQACYSLLPARPDYMACQATRLGMFVQWEDGQISAVSRDWMGRCTLTSQRMVLVLGDRLFFSLGWILIKNLAWRIQISGLANKYVYMYTLYAVHCKPFPCNIYSAPSTNLLTNFYFIILFWICVHGWGGVVLNLAREWWYRFSEQRDVGLLVPNPR